MSVRYWVQPSNIRYEVSKRVERVCLAIAMRLPTEVRKWVVVDATNEARRLYPEPDGYAGPDGLGYAEIYDGAVRRRRK